MRKLATIQRISAIRPIQGADAIEAADVLGWTVVVKKGEFSVGDLVVYFEVDSWLDASNPAFASFEERFVNWDGKRGMRLKTIKLRKQISQGLILPISSFVDLSPSVRGYAVNEGDDVTEALKIEKWESQAERESNSAGAKSQASKTRKFPWFLRVTDQNRIQNVGEQVAMETARGTTWEVTKKLDGSSLTIFFIGKDSAIYPTVVEEMRSREEAKMGWFKKAVTRVMRFFRVEKAPEFIYGVCSRNVWLDVEGDNHFSAMARQVREKIISRSHPVEAFAFQGELVSPSIQSNYEKVSKAEWYIFDVFMIDKQEYLLPGAAREFVNAFDLSYVPVVDSRFDIDTLTGGDVDVRTMTDKLLEMAEGPGMNPGVKREGLVFKSNGDSDVSFKAISNSYLLKNS